MPTGFITAQTGIEYKIREEIIKRNLLSGLISMPSNIFAATPTSVSILFLKKNSESGKVFLIDASKLGTSIKEGKVKKTLLSEDEEKLIIKTYNEKKNIKKFAINVSYERIKENDYSLSAAQYFDVEVKYDEMNSTEFKQEVKNFKISLKDLKQNSDDINNEIYENLKILKND